MIRQTSIETYNSIKNSGLLSDKRLKVYEIFYEYPQGLTGSQVAQIYSSKYPTSQHSETIRNRITELRDMGVLNEAGIVKCEYSNRNVIKFVLNDNMPKVLEAKPTLNQSLNSILEKIEKLGTQITDETQKESLREIYRGVNKLKKK